MLPLAATIHGDNLVNCQAGHERTQIIRAAAAVRASSLIRHHAVDGAAIYPRIIF